MTKCIFLLCLCVLFTNSIEAQKRKASVEVLDAISQTTFPGVQGAQPVTRYEFSMIWKSDMSPNSIYWNAENNWMKIQLYKITRRNKAADEAPLQTAILPQDLRAGDSIILIASTSSCERKISTKKFFKQEQTLFIKIKSCWENIVIKTIEKQPDILMP